MHDLDRGLRFFHTCIIASNEDQMSLLRCNANSSYSCLSTALEQAPEWDDPMYDACKREDTIAFHEDGYEDGPNAAWPWSTGNKIQISYHRSDRAGLRKWGYVMWDKGRLDQWSILQENFEDHLDW